MCIIFVGSRSHPVICVYSKQRLSNFSMSRQSLYASSQVLAKREDVATQYPEPYPRAAALDVDSHIMLMSLVRRAGQFG
ncbi:hypothetical protein EWB00_003274 [Schistosoma japonicum]|uniref:Uncharacterized protein n=1 Tax=Schistosoma japonicum TaxID=6182 RepID=A0A4Z2D8Q7_SCHJA|nr:hypothetical protein EWB00_003274 [Schistosoma japonicum]